MRIRALVFDFDGLILDTEGAAFRSWQEVFAEYGHELPQQAWTAGIGRGPGFFKALAYLQKLVGPDLDAALLNRKRRLKARTFAEAATVLPGVVERIREARNLGLKLAIASNSSRSYVYAHLTRLGLLGWDALCCGDEQPKKPDPALFAAAVRSLRVNPADAIAFEDSPAGVSAAKRAGLWCVAIPNPLTAALDFGDADIRLASLADQTLRELIESLGGRT